MSSFSPDHDWAHGVEWLGARPFTLEAGGGLRLRVCRDIREVEAREWDSVLEPDDLLMSHSFIRACQEARIEEAEFWHLLVYGNEQIICVATLYRMHVNLELLSNGLTRRLIERLKGLWPGFFRLPVLFCGLPVSSGQPCLKIRPEADYEPVCSVLTGAMERIARLTSTRLLCLKEFDPQAAGHMDSVLALGYFRALSLPGCALSLGWDSFSSYLDSMRSSYRRQVQSTLRARRTAGLEVRHLEQCEPAVETIFDLYSQTIGRAEHRLETLNPEFFRLLDTCLGERVKVILIESEGRPLAMAVMLFAGEVATFLFAGMEEKRRPEWQLYQNLISEVVASAIDAGARRLELGQTSYAMKSRMGAEESPRYLYLRYRGPLKHALLRGFSRALFPRHEYPRRRVFAQ
ncbi:MAG TPA: GNAT family N-acetyltransferase [Pyrinomonadaceae bacterium]|jgi:predicted N-acyltransferase